MFEIGISIDVPPWNGEHKYLVPEVDLEYSDETGEQRGCSRESVPKKETPEVSVVATHSAVLET